MRKVGKKHKVEETKKQSCYIILHTELFKFQQISLIHFILVKTD